MLNQNICIYFIVSNSPAKVPGKLLSKMYIPPTAKGIMKEAERAKKSLVTVKVDGGPGQEISCCCLPAAAVGAAGEGEGRTSRRGKVYAGRGEWQARERQGGRMSEIKLSKSKCVWVCMCVCAWGSARECVSVGVCGCVCVGNRCMCV